MTQKDKQDIFIFIGLSFLLCWLVTAPAWNFEEDMKRMTAFLFVIAMWTPGLSALILYLIRNRNPETNFRSFFHIKLGEKWIPHYLFHILFWPLAALATPFVGSFLGLFELDLTFSGFTQILQDMAIQHGAPDPIKQFPIETIVRLQIISTFTAFFVNIPFAIGEELGWRGYILPKLKPLGFWRANVILGIIWGLWHTPIILLGHNYPETPIQGLFLMVLFCCIIGTLFNWSVWHSKSIWPAIFGHGAINGSASVIILFQPPNYQLDPRWVGMTGITGWIIPLLVIGIIYMTKQYPEENKEL